MLQTIVHPSYFVAGTFGATQHLTEAVSRGANHLELLGRSSQLLSHVTPSETTTVVTTDPVEECILAALLGNESGVQRVYGQDPTIGSFLARKLMHPKGQYMIVQVPIKDVETLAKKLGMIGSIGGEVFFNRSRLFFNAAYRTLIEEVLQKHFTPNQYRIIYTTQLPPA